VEVGETKNLDNNEAVFPSTKEIDDGKTRVKVELSIPPGS